MRRVLGVGVLLGGAFVAAPMAWIAVVAVAGVLGGLLGIPPTPVFAGGGLCGMLAAFVVAVTSGLVARALFREPTGE